MALRAASIRAPAPAASSSPMPFEVSNDTTDASTPIARSLHRSRRARFVANTLTVACLGLIAAATVVTTRALSNHPVPGWGRAVPLPAAPPRAAPVTPPHLPVPDPSPVASALAPAHEPDEGPPSVAVSALPQASASSRPPLHPPPPAHILRRWHPAPKAAPKPAPSAKPDSSAALPPASSLDAIGGRE
jgi:hypothetical protein